MKNKIGKMLISTLILLLFVGTAALLYFTLPALARPVSGTISDKLGSYTGAGSGQGHNIKASLDLAHTDLDTGLEDFEDILALMDLGTGSVFYVDNAATGDADGTTWANAEVTIEGAIANCTANAGDFILVAPYHTETLGAGADGVDVDKAGITIIGLGKGYARPKIDYDTATDEFVLGAGGDDATIINLWFHSNIDSTVKAIDVEAGCIGWTIKNCLFDVETWATDEFDNAIIVGDASDGGTIENCEFRMGTADAVSAIFLDHDADYTRIIGNKIYGDYSTACIENDTAACIDIEIADNVLYNGQDGIGLNAQPCIEVHANTTGVIVNNTLVCNVTADTAIVAADMHLSGNTYSETEGSGTALVVGQTYVRISSPASVAASAVDLFDVLGGRIEIISMMGQCTTVMASNPGACSLIIDATTGDEDADFTTAVNIDSLGVGDVVNFAAVTGGEAVLVPTANVNGALPVSWFCPIGMIEQKTASTGTGAITWYMVFRPLEDGVTVTVQ